MKHCLKGSKLKKQSFGCFLRHVPAHFITFLNILEAFFRLRTSVGSRSKLPHKQTPYHVSGVTV
jgi:hypothetical protein